MRVERLATLDVGQSEGERVTQHPVLGHADRATGFAWFHEAAEDFGDRAIGRIVVGRKAVAWPQGQSRTAIRVRVSELGHFDSRRWDKILILIQTVKPKQRQSMIQSPYLLFLGDAPDIATAKTAAGIRQWRPELCAGQLRLPGCRVDLGLPDLTPAEAVRRGIRSADHWHRERRRIHRAELGCVHCRGIASRARRRIRPA